MPSVPRPQPNRCNAPPFGNSDFAFELRCWTPRGADTPSQDGGSILLYSIHPTWCAPPKKEMAPNGRFHQETPQRVTNLTKLQKVPFWEPIGVPWFRSPSVLNIEECKADAIPTTIRRRHGRGHLHPLCRRWAHCCISPTGYGYAATPVVTA